MKYKYKKGQIFGKKLHVSKEIQRKIYQNELSLIDYIQNQLDDKIPVSCLRKSDRKIVQEFGLERIKKLDWEMFYMLDEDMDLGEIFENIDSDMNKSLYEFLKDKISLEHYSDQMKKEYPNRFFDDVGTTHDEISDFKNKFNSNVPISEVYELYKKNQPKPKVETPGSMKNTGTANSIKDLYSYEEASKFTKEDYDKNPELFKAVEKSMLKW